MLALSNDRRGRFSLLRLSPRICAEFLASHIAVHHRRISSEFNRADRLPRLWEAPVGGMRSPDPHGMVWWPKAMEAMILCRRCCGNGMRERTLMEKVSATSCSPQAKSSRSTSIENCLSEALEVSREFPEQHPRATGRHVARANDVLRVGDYIKHGAQHQEGAGHVGLHTQGRQDRPIKDAGQQRERDFWLSRQGKQENQRQKHTARL